MPNTQHIIDNYHRFLSIISHDFQAPLRHTKEFTNLLVESLKENLDGDQKKYIEFINSSLSRIDKMQTALLTLSRVVTNTETKEKINSNLFIEGARKKVFKEFEISSDELPHITVIPTQFSMLFENIISNAVTYTPYNRKPIIIINTQKTKKYITFEFSDNGIGIDEHYHEDIFNMFRRLHSENDFGGGVGAGLTIAKEIVAHHNGKIWLESQINKGSTFYIQIPNIDA